ncbi:MAG TPA: ferredoxin [Candidatus Gracilibacteria bacterium]|nr:ferredoxin [Candidatus Gracilibacteria bacterium]
MSISIDQSSCLCCGACAAICPQAFEISATEGCAVVKAGANPEDPAVANAIAACPAACISLVLDDEK